MFLGGGLPHQEKKKKKIQMCDITFHFCLVGLFVVCVWYNMHELPCSSACLSGGHGKIVADGEGWKTHIYVDGLLTGSHA